jgi:hypothetical protein
MIIRAYPLSLIWLGIAVILCAIGIGFDVNSKEPWSLCLPGLPIFLIWFVIEVIAWRRGVIKLTTDKMIVNNRMGMELSLNLKDVTSIRFDVTDFLIDLNGSEILVSHIDISPESRGKILDALKRHKSI